MIDLHLHLDGSISVNSAIQLATVQNIMLPTTNKSSLTRIMSVNSTCKNLSEYLSYFELPLKLLQTPLAIKLAMKNLLVELSEIGITYAEVRFAPQLHTRCGATQSEIILAAISGIEDYYYSSQDSASPLFKANLILCCMRGANNYDENAQTVQLAAKFLGKGVVAIDLAGDESRYPTSDYMPLLRLAGKLNVPYTIHAGEADGVDSIYSAIEMGASRIGHGVRAVESRELMQMLSDRRIPLELCPTSNLQTKVIPNIKGFPLNEFLDYGIIATINSDNMTVSNTNIKNEFSLINSLKLSANDIAQLGRNAISASFMTAEERKLYQLSNLH